MADNINPQVISFLGNDIRPMAEKIRNLKYEIDSLLITWYNGMNNLTGSNSDNLIEDGRGDEGVSRITEADITNFVSLVVGLQTTFNGGGIMDVISKPCVRNFRAES